jgi:CRP-like cAMP-binding protein
MAALTHLHSLSFDELAQLAPHAGERWLPAGRRILLGGSLHHELALIGAGRGVVRCAGETVAKLGPGDVFGELSTRRSAYETASVHAVTALHLVVFSSRAVRILRAASPDALDALLAACALDVRERCGALAGQRPAPELRLVAASAA